MKLFLETQNETAAIAKIAEVDAAVDLAAMGAVTSSVIAEKKAGKCLLIFDDRIPLELISGYMTKAEAQATGWL